MDNTGKRVTVTVEGFGSKSGVVERYDEGAHRPYHVAFDDGMSGWFDGVQVGVFRLVPASDARRPAEFGILIYRPAAAAGSFSFVENGDWQTSATAHLEPLHDGKRNVVIAPDGGYAIKV